MEFSTIFIIVVLIGLGVGLFVYMSKSKKALRMFRSAWQYHQSQGWSSTLTTINSCLDGKSQELKGKYHVLKDLQASLDDYKSDLIIGVTEKIGMLSNPMTYLANDLFSKKVDQLMKLYKVTDTEFRDSLIGLHVHSTKSSDRIFTMDKQNVIHTLKIAVCGLIRND